MDKSLKQLTEELNQILDEIAAEEIEFKSTILPANITAKEIHDKYPEVIFTGEEFKTKELAQDYINHYCKEGKLYAVKFGYDDKWLIGGYLHFDESLNEATPKIWYELYLPEEGSEKIYDEDNFYEEYPTLLEARKAAKDAMKEFGYEKFYLYKMSPDWKRPQYCDTLTLDMFDESLNEDTIIIDNGKEFKVDDIALDIVRETLLDVMRGYGWVDLEQLQDYIKEEGIELTDEELIATAKACLRYTKVFDAEELQDTDLQDIESAAGTVIVVGDFKKRTESQEEIAKKQFEKLVEEAHDIYWQGYKFIDYTLLSIHCPAFEKISEKDGIELIKSWGYTVVDGDDIEAAIALGKEFSEGDLRKMIHDFDVENGMDESLNEEENEDDEICKIVVFGALPTIKEKVIKPHNFINSYEIYTGKKRAHDGVLLYLPEDEAAGFEQWLQENNFKYADKDELDESLNEDSQNLLDNIAREIYDEIEKIYNYDEDLLEYVYVEPFIKEGYYDDGSDMYGIEVRAEQTYEGMVNLADKLDKIIQKYDKTSYFDQVDGGIMEAVLDIDNLNMSLNEDDIHDDLINALKDEKESVERGIGWISMEQVLMDLEQEYNIDSIDIPLDIIKKEAKKILGKLIKEDKNESLNEEDKDLHKIWKEEMQREPIIDTQDGPIYLQVSEDGKSIEFGTLTNNGMVVEGSVEYDFNYSLDQNIQDVAEEIFNLHDPIFEDGSEPYSDSKFDRLSDLFSESLDEKFTDDDFQVGDTLSLRLMRMGDETWYTLDDYNIEKDEEDDLREAVQKELEEVALADWQDKDPLITDFEIIEFDFDEETGDGWVEVLLK